LCELEATPYKERRAINVEPKLSKEEEKLAMKLAFDMIEPGYNERIEAAKRRKASR